MGMLQTLLMMKQSSKRHPEVGTGLQHRLCLQASVPAIPVQPRLVTHAGVPRWCPVFYRAQPLISEAGAASLKLLGLQPFFEGRCPPLKSGAVPTSEERFPHLKSAVHL